VGKNKLMQGVLYSGLLLSSSLFSSTLSQKIENSSLIVYNGNIGLVHEERALSVNKKDTTVTYTGVASTINTDSVNIQLSDSIKLYSQQYRFDKLTQAKILNAHIGKKIQVRLLKDAKNFKIIDATLLSNDGGSSLVKTTKNRIISVASNAIIFKSIPKELITKPSLVWNIKASKNVNTTMKIDYLISNIDWKSDYVLNLHKDSADLTGWITLNNRSGKSFKNTELNVLAGDINRAYRQRNVRYSKAMPVMAMAESDSVSHVAHEGYHFYTVPFKVNLANNEKTQIKFIQKSNIYAQRSYVANMTNPSYMRGESQRGVTQFVNLKGVDLPLPKGIIRTYSKLGAKNVLLGESNLKHTPKDTPIKLMIGKNFDVKVKESVISRDDDKRYYDATIKYTLKNSSNEVKQVSILVPFNRHKDSKIKTSQHYTFTKGNLVTFNISVFANSSKSFEVQFESKK